MRYFIYNFLLTAVFLAVLPLLPLLLVLRPRLGRGLAERFGYFSKSKLQTLLETRPIWIHAASVGETLAAGALIAALKARLPERKILLSTFTATGNEMARRRAGADVVIFFPVDHALVVRRLLAKLEPAILIIIETEIWPNLLRQLFKRGIPALLLSGRFSERGFKRYFKFRGFFRPVVRCFAACGMQSRADADKMILLGADAARIAITGNLKQLGAAVGIATGASESASAAARQLSLLLAAGSTHRGEEAILLEVFVALKKRFPELQLALAPRHPQRFAEVEKLLRQTALSFTKKSLLDGLNFQDDVLLLDTLGDLPALYALADVAFVGGSLVDVGGHNLLEPAFFRKPVVFGPYATSSAKLAGDLKRSGGGIEVRGADDLVRELDALLSDPGKRRRAGANAYRVALLDGAVLERSLDLLGRYIDLPAEREVRAAHHESVAL